MSRKLIIVIAVPGLLSFVGAFALAWLTHKGADPRSSVDERGKPAVAGDETDMGLPSLKAGAMGALSAGRGDMKRAMTEEQLKRLVYEVRDKVEEYEDKLESLKVREERLRVAQDVLKKDIDELNNLRVDLVSIVASLKEERDRLHKSRVEIAETEKVNLMSIAAAYDKMDSVSAGKILTNMTKVGNGRGGSGFDDAVKILYYMTERTKAKLLAELVSSEPDLAAVLCRRLKQIVEEK